MTTSSTLLDRIRARLAELEAARAEHAQQAQRTDYGYAAAIGELQQLLALAEQPELPSEEHDHARVQSPE